MLFGASTAAFGLIWTNTLQEMVPRHMLGRASSIDFLGSFVFVAVGFGVVGWATDAEGAPTVFVVGGAVSAGLSALGLLHRGVRQMD